MLSPEGRKGCKCQYSTIGRVILVVRLVLAEAGFCSKLYMYKITALLFQVSVMTLKLLATKPRDHDDIKGKKGRPVGGEAIIGRTQV